jgi:hypothetical protein
MKKNYNRYLNSYGEKKEEYQSVKISSGNIDYKKDSSYLKEDYTSQNLTNTKEDYENSATPGFIGFKKMNTVCPLKGNNFFYYGVS